MKWLPNALSLSRFFMAITLFFFTPFSVVFVVVYVVAVMTDAVDGFFARRFNSQSKLGDNLDTLADFTLVGITLFRIVPVMAFTAQSIGIIVSIFALKIVALLVSYIKFKQVISLTTYLSKLMAVAAFSFPFLYWLIKHVFPHIYESGTTENMLVLYMGVVCIFIALEEVLIHLSSSIPRPDAKGFLFDNIQTIKNERGDIMATYNQIRNYVKEKHGFLPRGTWIAHMKEICGLNPKPSVTRRSPDKRVNPCPPEKQDALREAFAHFKLI
jgi:CDP-diacylglycerol--glycerol-3-phosphate 3-phosphatidyltransferase